MSLNKPTGLGKLQNFIQIDREICKKMSAAVSGFLYNCYLE